MKPVILLVLVAIALLAAMSRTKLFFVDANSMSPTLLPGDILLCAISNMPSKGDIIVARKRGGIDGWIIVKRIAGVPGETIRYIDTFISTNGVDVPEINKLVSSSYTDLSQSVAYRLDYLFSGRNQLASPYEVYLERGNYFLLGDNRINSVDSRTFGPIQLDDIVCKAHIVLGNLRGHKFDISRLHIL